MTTLLSGDIKSKLFGTFSTPILAGGIASGLSYLIISGAEKVPLFSGFSLDERILSGLTVWGSSAANETLSRWILPIVTDDERILQGGSYFAGPLLCGTTNLTVTAALRFFLGNSDPLDFASLLKAFGVGFASQIAAKYLYEGAIRPAV